MKRIFSDRPVIYGILCCWLFLTISVYVDAQHIQLDNPSFEGRPGINILPAPWKVAGGTPDTQPGMFQIKVGPSAGRSYIGLHGGKRFMEAIAQELPAPLTPGTTYIMSLDLAYVTAYLYPTCYGNLAIYTGNTPGDTAELLWSSGDFTHTNWKKYQAVFTPKASYAYISFWIHPVTPCNKSEYGIALLLDNLSGIDKLVLPEVKVEVKPCSCGEVADGQIILHAYSGVPPYQYRLDNGMWQTDSVFRELAAGPHSGEVRDSHELPVTFSATVESPWKNCLVVLPNAFSPNNDGQNDIFRPKVYDAIYDYRIQVYDRWGKLVFVSNVPEAGWDGTFKGAPADVQAYVYICTYTDSRQTQHVLKGSVLLLR